MSKTMRTQRMTTKSRSTALVEMPRDTCESHWAFRGILERSFLNEQKHAQFITGLVLL